MTTATLAAGNRAMDNVVRPRRSLEELVDRLMDALFTTMETAVRPRRSLAELVDQLMAALKFGDDDGTAERSAPQERSTRPGGSGRRATSTVHWRPSQRWTRRGRTRTRPGGPFPSGSSW